MGNTALEYFLFVFVAACGVLQMASARGRLWGLMFIGRCRWSYGLGLVAIVGAFWWFFTIDDRGVPGLEGGPQLGLFTAASISAILFTLLFPSVIKARRQAKLKANPPTTVGESQGLGTLKEMTYLQAWLRRFRRETR